LRQYVHFIAHIGDIINENKPTLYSELSPKALKLFVIKGVFIVLKFSYYLINLMSIGTLPPEFTNSIPVV